jgi:hypothetical protein
MQTLRKKIGKGHLGSESNDAIIPVLSPLLFLILVKVKKSIPVTGCEDP